MSNLVNAFGRNSGNVKERLWAIVPERRFTMQILKRFKAITRSITSRPASLHSFIYVGDAIATPYAYGRIIK